MTNRNDTRRALALGLLLSCAAGCSEPVLRVVSLAGAPQMLPGGAAQVVGDELRVEMTAAEPLAEGKRHVLWAETRTERVALAELEPGMHTAVPLTGLGVAPSDIQELFVTEEDSGGSLPATPAREVVRGVLPGLLLLGGDLDAAAFEEASGTAELRDRQIAVDAELPELPAGFRYEVWLGFPAAGTAPQAHAESAGHGAAPSTMWLAGGLSEGKLDRTTDRFLPEATVVRVTIESDNGHPDDMAMARALSGNVETEGGGSAEGGTEEGGAEHMH